MHQFLSVFEKSNLNVLFQFCMKINLENLKHNLKFMVMKLSKFQPAQPYPFYTFINFEDLANLHLYSFLHYFL